MNILILGAGGQVGCELLNYFKSTPHHIIPFYRQQLDLSGPLRLSDYLKGMDIDLIINAAAYTAVDLAEDETELAYHINAEAVKELAMYCQSRHIPLIHFSTDYIFDGSKPDGYCEQDTPHPLSTYGQTKLQGEEYIQTFLDNYIILRVSWVFASEGRNFVNTILKLAQNKEILNIVEDQWGCPTAAKDIARVIGVIVNAIQTPHFKDWGIYHYAGVEKTNWYAFADGFLNLARERGLRLKLNQLNAIMTEDYPMKAQRPKYSILQTNKIEQTFNLSCHHWVSYLPEVIDTFISKEKNNVIST